MLDDEFDDLDAGQREQETAFHIEADLYDSGDYTNMLVVVCGDNYIVVTANEHLCTLTRTCNEPECWEQVDGVLDDDLVERIGAAIQGYTGDLNTGDESATNY